MFLIDFFFFSLYGITGLSGGVCGLQIIIPNIIQYGLNLLFLQFTGLLVAHRCGTYLQMCMQMWYL